MGWYGIGVVWNGMVWYCTVWHDMLCYAVLLYGMVLVWYIVDYTMNSFGVVRLTCSVTCVVATVKLVFEDFFFVYTWYSSWERLRIPFPTSGTLAISSKPHREEEPYKNYHYSFLRVYGAFSHKVDFGPSD